MMMREKHVGIRELKSTLSECVREVKSGHTIVVTSHLSEVKGNKLYFEVECREGDTLLGTGVHKRAVVLANF